MGTTQGGQGGRAVRREERHVVSTGPVRQMVFVMHHVAGVRLIPRDWLEGFLPSGFREATAGEIAFWHEERGLEPPVDGEVPQEAPGIHAVPETQQAQQAQETAPLMSPNAANVAVATRYGDGPAPS
jgi:hypothetical protein